MFQQKKLIGKTAYRSDSSVQSIGLGKDMCSYCRRLGMWLHSNTDCLSRGWQLLLLKKEHGFRQDVYSIKGDSIKLGKMDEFRHKMNEQKPNNWKSQIKQ